MHGESCMRSAGSPQQRGHLRKRVWVVERRRLPLQVGNLLLQLKLLPPGVRHLRAWHGRKQQVFHAAKPQKQSAECWQAAGIEDVAVTPG